MNFNSFNIDKLSLENTCILTPRNDKTEYKVFQNTTYLLVNMIIMIVFFLTYKSSFIELHLGRYNL